MASSLASPGTTSIPIVRAVAYITHDHEVLGTVCPYKSNPEDFDWSIIREKVLAKKAAQKPPNTSATSGGRYSVPLASTFYGLVHTQPSEYKIYASGLPTGIVIAVQTADKCILDEKIRELCSRLSVAWMHAAANPLAPLPGASAVCGVMPSTEAYASANSPGIVWPKFIRRVQATIDELDPLLELQVPSNPASPQAQDLHALRMSARSGQDA